MNGALYVQVLHGMRTDDPSYLLRIDAGSGETVWRVERPTEAVRESPDSYTTPALLHHDGRIEIVITGGDAVTGHDPATGLELWRADGLNPTRNRSYRIVASPVVHDGVIYAPTRVRPLLALRPGGRGDVLDSHVMWSTDNGPDVPTPVSDGTHFYVVNDRGIVFAMDAKTGAPVLRSGADSAGHLQRVAGAGRRQDLRDERGRPDHRPARRTPLRGARGKRPGRLLLELAGHLRRPDIHPHQRLPLRHRRAPFRVGQLNPPRTAARISGLRSPPHRESCATESQYPPPPSAVC